MAALDAAADVDVVSTLEAEAARLASELAAQAEQRRAGRPSGRSWRAQPALEAEAASLRAALVDAAGARMCRTRPSPGSAPVPSWWPAPRPGAAGHGRLGTRVWRSSSGRRRGRAGRPPDQGGRRARKATASWRPSWPPRGGAGAAARAAETSQASADEAEEGRFRTAARAEALERAVGGPAGRRWARAAAPRRRRRGLAGRPGRDRRRAGTPRSRLPPARASPPSWSTARRSAQAALATLRGAGVTGAVLAPRHAGARGRRDDGGLAAAGQQRRARARPRPGAPGRDGGRVGARHAGRPRRRVDGWEEAIDLSLARDDLVVATPEGDRFAATWVAGAPGTGVVTTAAVEEARRKAERSRRRRRAGAGEPDRGRDRAGLLPGMPVPRPSGPSTGTARPARPGGPTRSRAAEEQRRLTGELDEARAAVTEAAARGCPR